MEQGSEVWIRKARPVCVQAVHRVKHHIIRMHLQSGYRQKITQISYKGLTQTKTKEKTGKTSEQKQ